MIVFTKFRKSHAIYFLNRLTEHEDYIVMPFLHTAAKIYKAVLFSRFLWL